MEPGLPFAPHRFHAALTTRWIGRFFVYRPLTDTTMELARREALEGAPHGTIAFAEAQHAGRGRKGRSFYSPGGDNLYFTFVLRLPAEVQRLLPVAVPLAVCEAVRDQGVDAAIKWPNDVWAAGRKLSGMLIDAEISAEGGIAYPGIGINVNGDPTENPELRDIATSIRRELGRTVQRETLLASVCNRLEAAIDADAAALVARYRELSMVLGCPVTVTSVTGEAYAATAREIAPDGALVIERASGGLETVTAAEVSLRPA